MYNPNVNLIDTCSTSQTYYTLIYTLIQWVWACSSSELGAASAASSVAGEKIFWKERVQMIHVRARLAALHEELEHKRFTCKKIRLIHRYFRLFRFALSLTPADAMYRNTLVSIALLAFLQGSTARVRAEGASARLRAPPQRHGPRGLHLSGQQVRPLHCIVYNCTVYNKSRKSRMYSRILSTLPRITDVRVRQRRRVCGRLVTNSLYMYG